MCRFLILDFFFIILVLHIKIIFIILVLHMKLYTSSRRIWHSRDFRMKRGMRIGFQLLMWRTRCSPWGGGTNCSIKSHTPLVTRHHHTMEQWIFFEIWLFFTQKACINQPWYAKRFILKNLNVRICKNKLIMNMVVTMKEQYIVIPLKQWRRIVLSWNSQTDGLNIQCW